MFWPILCSYSNGWNELEHPSNLQKAVITAVLKLGINERMGNTHSDHWRREFGEIKIYLFSWRRTKTYIGYMGFRVYIQESQQIVSFFHFC